MDLQEVLEHDHLAANEFSPGNPEPVKVLWSHGGDVSLATPFGPAVRGWKQVSATLNAASSRMREGEVTGFERVAEYVSADLASILEVERWQAKSVRGRTWLPLSCGS
jgi:hypothetical protein